MKVYWDQDVYLVIKTSKYVLSSGYNNMNDVYFKKIQFKDWNYSHVVSYLNCSFSKLYPKFSNFMDLTRESEETINYIIDRYYRLLIFK